MDEVTRTAILESLTSDARPTVWAIAREHNVSFEVVREIGRDHLAMPDPRPMRNVPRYDHDQIRNLIVAGQSTDDIMRDTGCPRTVVGLIRKRLKRAGTVKS